MPFLGWTSVSDVEFYFDFLRYIFKLWRLFLCTIISNITYFWIVNRTRYKGSYALRPLNNKYNFCCIFSYYLFYFWTFFLYNIWTLFSRTSILHESLMSLLFLWNHYNSFPLVLYRQNLCPFGACAYPKESSRPRGRGRGRSSNLRTFESSSTKIKKNL